MSPPPPERFTFPGATHAALADAIEPGDLVVDATAGWGRDTLFLARQVGDGGTVVAIDRQAQAIEGTRNACEEAGLLERVELHHACHSELARVLAED